MTLIIGIIGSLCMLIAWLFEAIESIREHKAMVDLRFSFIYLAGVIVLTWYSIIIQDPVFTFLNIAILIIVISEVLYTMWKIKRMI